MPFSRGQPGAVSRGSSRRLLGVLAVAVGLSWANRARAEVLPGPDPYGDAADVDLIVEGRVVGGDRVAIGRTIFAVTPLAEGVREIAVEGLSRHDRRVGDEWSSSDGTDLEAVDVLLLLRRTAVPGTWRPHHLLLTADPRNPGGATGTYWIKDDKVWCYAQSLNPGPLVVQAWRFDGTLAGTAGLLRSEISQGLEARRAWESDLALADPAERAARLVRWISPATSPDAGRRTRRRYAVRSLVGKLGPAAVPALVTQLAEGVDPIARDEALLTLGDLGPAAKAALPRLLELTADPRGTPRSRLAYALRNIGDARAVAPLREILAAADLDDMDSLRSAADGLVRNGDPEAARRIAAKLPETTGHLRSPTGLLALLDVLREADPARLRAWLEPRAGDAVFRHVQGHVAGLLQHSEAPRR